MAEIGIAASIVAVIQVSSQVAKICRLYIEKVKDAPSDLRKIYLEISTLKTVFEHIEFLASHPSGDNDDATTILSILSGPDSPINASQVAVDELESLFPSHLAQGFESDGKSKRKVKATLTTLAWPLKEKKAKKLLDEISRCKDTLALVLTSENTSVGAYFNCLSFQRD